MRLPLDRYAVSDVDFVPVAPEPHSGPRRATRAKEILLTSQGLCRDIKGRALNLVLLEIRAGLRTRPAPPAGSIYWEELGPATVTVMSFSSDSIPSLALTRIT